MIVIRDMKCEDVARVAQIEEETFSMPWCQNAFLEMLANEHAHYLVAEEDGLIVGICGLRDILGEGDVTNVAVISSHRNRGIGYTMLVQLLKTGQRYGVTAVTLEVRQSNVAAIHLYEKLGFKIEGIRKNFYSDPQEHAAIMWRREKEAYESK
ncbi:MAG: ribosomal protein S18-alanine N-acetyltransferase [Lachnospiraceae bacterium]